MFDLDCLARFDRGLSTIASGPHRTTCARQDGPQGDACSDALPDMRCGIVTNLRTEPMCPFARMEVA